MTKRKESLSMKLKAVFVVYGLLGLSLSACVPGGVNKSAIKSDDEKLIYSLGKNFGDRIKTYDLNEKEKKILLTGVMDSLTGKESKADVGSFGMAFTRFTDQRFKEIAKKEKEAAQPYIKKMSEEEGAKILESGVVFKSIKDGGGKFPKDTDTVKVNYHGTLRDGSVFDSSIEKLPGSPREPQPAKFALQQVIPCWTEAIQKIKVGGKAKITCPTDKAYGDRGAPPKIKPGAPLTFEVELLEIVKVGKKDSRKKPKKK